MRMKSLVFGLVPIALRIRALSPTEVDGMARRRKVMIWTLKDIVRRM